MCPPKIEIEKRIRKRFIDMLEDGAIKETENFIKKRVNSLKSSNFIIGINEISKFLKTKFHWKKLKKELL